MVADMTNLHFLLLWKLLITSISMSKVICIQDFDEPMKPPFGHSISAEILNSLFKVLIISH